VLKQTRLLLLLILLVCCNTVLAQSEGPELEDTARQLVSPGWEELAPQEDEPLIIYSLRLIELNSDMAGVLKATVELSVNQEPQGGYTVVTDQAVLTWVGEYPNTFTADLSGVWESKASGSGYDAWLITMGERSVSLELAEDRITGSRTDDTVLDQGLKIVLTPRHLYSPEGGVLTDVTLEYLNLSGALGEAELTTRIGPVASHPLAVVIQEVETNHGRSKRYFALYATASTIASSALPERGPLVPIGSIRGLQELFSAPESSGAGWTKFRVGLAHLQGEVGLDAGLELEKRKYKVYVTLDGFESGWGYRVGGDWRLEQELGLAAHIDQRPDSEPILRLGLSDQVHWGDLELEATYLPFSFAGGKGQLTDSPWLHFGAMASQAGWGLRYEFTYDTGKVGHGIVVIKQLNPHFDLDLSWTRSPAGEDYYGIAMVFWRK
jgi:hypothetical protein